MVTVAGKPEQSRERAVWTCLHCGTDSPVACDDANEETFLGRYCSYMRISPVKGFKLGPKDAHSQTRAITVADIITAECSSSGRLLVWINLTRVRNNCFMGKFTPNRNVQASKGRRKG